MKDEIQQAYEKDHALLFELEAERRSVRNQMSPKLSARRLRELQKEVDELDKDIKTVGKRVAEEWNALNPATTEPKT